MGVFFIDTSTGTVATQRQLIEAGVATTYSAPPRPWLEIRATGDASTMWYEVLRKRERGIFIGTLVLRHSGHHASLLERGWEPVPIDEIAVPPSAG
ncbi:MAG TPA: hypothetical protein VFB41_01315 [Solirubrobacteraceae bacterium]|nr:hypothetical protein [Solirubrobacteraceae bacterium]